MYISKKSIKQHYSDSLTQEMERLATHDNYKYNKETSMDPRHDGGTNLDS